MLHQIAVCVLCKNQEITRFPQFFVIMMAHKFSRLGGFILHRKSQMHIIFVKKRPSRKPTNHMNPEELA